MNSEKTFKIIDDNSGKYIDFLAKICSYEARAKDKEVIDKMMTYVEEYAYSEGMQVKRIPFEKCGDCLLIEINAGADKSFTLLAHMDTVHDAGIFGEEPVKIEGDKMTAPGAIDCKGGVAVALLAMKALKEAGYQKNIRLLLNTDEEITNSLGGEKEQLLIRDTIDGFKASLNCETGRENGVVVSRSGILRMEVDITGIGGHSGGAYFQGASAILEASHKIIEFESKSRKDGSTYNCSLIKGGTVANNIPDNCKFTVDIRVNTVKDMEEAERYVYEITERVHIPGTSAKANIVSKRPPMEKNAKSMRLFEIIKKVYDDLGYGEIEPLHTRGGSDSAYTQLAGIPSVCAMGPWGDFGHTNKEYVNLHTVAERAKIITYFAINNLEEKI